MAYTGKIIKIINEGTGSNVILLVALPGYARNKALKKELDSSFVPILGHCFSPSVGDYIDFEGKVHYSKEHGHQLYANFIHPHFQFDGRYNKDLLLELLAEVQGASKAKKLIAHIPEKSIKKLYFESPSHSETDQAQAFAAVISVVRRARNIAPRYSYLRSIGVSSKSALYSADYFGSGLEKLVSNNPFRLYSVPNIQAKDVDSAAESLKASKNKQMKFRAISQSIVSDYESEGHTCYPFKQFLSKGSALAGSESDFYDCLIEDFSKKSLLLLDGGDGLYVATPSSFRREKQIHRAITNLNQRNGFFKPLSSKGLGSTILNKKQVEAVDNALLNPVSIISGGAGTGKTTTLREFVSQLRKVSAKKLRVTGCAPAGKASARMREAAGIDASTIHELLGYNPSTNRCRYNSENPLPYDAVLLDEASMVDARVFLDLCQAIKPGARLVLIGDFNQLPSVNAGAILRDLIDSKEIAMSELEVNERIESKGSLIYKNSISIVNGEMPDLETQGSDFHFIPASTDQKIKELTVKIATQLNQVHGVPLDDIQVISPQKGTQSGVNELNKALKPVFNPDTKGRLSIYGKEYHVGDRVIQNKNNKDDHIMNGESGKITAIDYSSRELSLKGEFGDKAVSFSKFGTFDHSFCSTIHKSQGSEFPVVIVPVSMSHKRMLSRQLLYTGLTRGKQKVYFVGSKEAVQCAIENTQSLNRHTLLRKFFDNPKLRPLVSLDDLTSDYSDNDCANDCDSDYSINKG